MLQIKDLTISYDKQIVLDKINLNVNKKEIICIVGESGSGKTTIIKTIMGLLSDSAKIVNGEIIYKEKSILNISKKQHNKLRGKEIAMMFQDAGLSLNPIRTIGKQFVQYIMTHKDVTKQEAYTLAVTMLEKMNLQNPENIMKSYMFNLSGGMKQRVGLAFSLALNPDLLLLDEPTSALDVTTQAQVVDEIIKLRDDFDTTILMITHNIPLAIYMADRIAVMKKGQIVEIDSAHKIFYHPQHEYTKKLIDNIPDIKSDIYER